jgi:hypothetical protein
MAGTLLGTLVFGVINASLVFLNVAASWQNLVSGGVLIFAVTVTAITDMRRDRHSGRDSSFGESLGRFLLRRSPANPVTGAEPTPSHPPTSAPSRANAVGPSPATDDGPSEGSSTPGAAARGPLPPHSH